MMSGVVVAKLSGPGGQAICALAKDCRSWMPGAPAVSRYGLPIPPDLAAGRYDVSIGLFDESVDGDRPVEFALKASIRDDPGYYRVATILVTAP